MARFCGNCGSEAAEGAKMCGACGAPLEVDMSKLTIPGLEYSNSEEKTKHKKITVFLIFVIAIAIVASAAFKAIGSFGYRGAVDDYFDALNKGDISLLIELMPDFEKEKFKTLDFTPEEFFERRLSSSMPFLKEQYGADIKFSYDIDDSERLSPRELESIKASIEDDMEGIKYSADNITKAVSVEIEINVRGEYDRDTDETILVLIKENGSWKIFSGNLLY